MCRYLFEAVEKQFKTTPALDLGTEQAIFLNIDDLLKILK